MVQKIIKIINNYKLKSLYNIILIVQIVLYFLYVGFLKKKALAAFSNRDLIDKNYYLSVFDNLDNSILIVLVVTIVFLLFGKFLNKIVFQTIKTNPILVYIVCFYFCVQIFCVIFIKTQPISDSLFYIKHAQGLMNYHEYRNNAGNLTAFWPIGLPFLIYLLSLFHHSYYFSICILNVFMNVFGLVFLIKIFNDYLNEKQLITFSLLYVAFPNNILSANIIMTDYPFLAIFWIIIYIALKKSQKHHLILLGGLIGLLTYLRATGIVTLFIVLIVFFLKYKIKTTLINISIVVFFAFLTISPWIYRNLNVFDSLVISSTNGGFNFLMGNNENAKGNVSLNFEYDSNNPDEVSESKKAYTKGLNFILHHPVKLLILIPSKIFYSYIRGDSSLTWSLKKTKNKIPGFFVSLLFYFTNMFFYFCVVLSFWSIRKSVNSKCTLIDKLNMIIYLVFILLIVVFVGSERYLIPIYPLHFYYVAKLA